MKDEKMSVKNKNDDWLEEINQRLDCLRDDQASFFERQSMKMVNIEVKLYELQKRQATIWRLMDKMAKKK